MMFQDLCAKTPTGEDEPRRAKDIRFAAEAVCRAADKSLGICRAADFISGAVAAVNNPFNFQMQALWVDQCAPW